ncbi:MAG: anaerobic ribonucleoside-triphosphate reductase activating protein [Spirochaetae bacterium HGW-Spirochaetae-1]|jgi:pyruvate formate lyase activating enzyme|nr:MAG: anaerobic ribonucleoside-triphosphate reductase activating protein [Spirochaetae bacterium HGW-Spirochaetae-1]
MNIRGIFKTSLIDFPGRISAVIFTGGCNLRCRYCHNPELARDSSELDLLQNEEVLSFLRRRKGLIDGVTLTGGEPTLRSDIDAFLEQVRDIPLDIKLDTNGLSPAVLERLISKKLVDYVAIDIKTSPEKYHLLTGRSVDFSLIRRSIDIIQESGVDYEVRTTCVPEFVTGEDLEKIHLSLGYVKKYCLQQFVPTVPLIDESLRGIRPYSPAELYRFCDYVETFTRTCEVRGV